MNNPNLRPINSESLRQITPAIREAWRTDNLKVFLALCLKDSIKQGMSPNIAVASSCVLALEWLADYLNKNHAATASVEDSTVLVVSLVHESITLLSEIS